MPARRRILWMLGYLPSLFGVVVLLLYIGTSLEIFILIGGGALLIGVPTITIIGILWAHDPQADRDAITRSLVLTTVTGGLCAVLGLAWITCYVLTVENSGPTVTHVHIKGGGEDVWIDSLAADDSETRYLWFGGADSPLTMHFQRQGQMHTVELEYYVTSSMGGYTRFDVAKAK